MRLAIGSFTYPWAIGVPGYPPTRPLTAVGLLDRAAALGVKVVQICDNLPLDRLTPAELTALSERAHRLGISVEVGTRGLGRRRLLSYLALAQQLGSPIVRTVTDSADSVPSDVQIVQQLRAVAADYETAAVTLAVENHGRHASRRLVRLLEEVDSPRVRVCLDTANSLGALERPEETLEVLAPWAVNLHLKDYTVRRLSHQFGYEITGCPVGGGMLDVVSVLDRMRRMSVDVSVVVELWTPPEATLEATIALQERWASDSVSYLRALLPA